MSTKKTKIFKKMHFLLYLRVNHEKITKISKKVLQIQKK